MPTVFVQGRELEYVSMPAPTRNHSTLVFLHEGLGSIGLWRDFPQRLGRATGCGVVVYSRYGYGNSTVFGEARDVDYMHHEGQQVLPELLATLDVRHPILVGHSDGASIALICAGSGQPLRALIVEAPHVFVEDISIQGIEAARDAYRSSDLPQRLGRYHRDPDKTFWGWNEIWLSPAFRSWNIEEYLPRIHCPVLAIQGLEDEYGSMAQLEAIAHGVRGRCERVAVPACRHSPHRDQPELVLEAMRKFVAELPSIA